MPGVKERFDNAGRRITSAGRAVRLHTRRDEPRRQDENRNADGEDCDDAKQCDKAIGQGLRIISLDLGCDQADAEPIIPSRNPSDILLRANTAVTACKATFDQSPSLRCV